MPTGSRLDNCISSLGLPNLSDVGGYSYSRLVKEVEFERV